MVEGPFPISTVNGTEEMDHNIAVGPQIAVVIGLWKVCLAFVTCMCSQCACGVRCPGHEKLSLLPGRR